MHRPPFRKPESTVHVPIPEGNESTYVKALREQSAESVPPPDAKSQTLLDAAARMEVLAANCTDGGAYKQGWLDAATELRTMARMEESR